MKRLIGTATVAALAAAHPYVALAQSSKAPNPPEQSVQAEVKQALEAAGFKDVKVDPHRFVVHAQDPSGSPATILINPDTFGGAAAPKPQENIDMSSSKSGSSQSGGPSQKSKR
jgi:hypothetical protein